MSETDSIQKKDLEKLKQLEIASKPLWLTRKYVEKPFLVISVCSVIFLICTILSIAFGLFAQSESEDREWLVWSDEKVQEQDLWNEAVKVFKKESEDQDVPVRSEEIEDWSTFIMLECYKNCDNILTPEYINMLRDAEKQIQNLQNYGNFCLATPEDSACSDDALVSISNLFTDAELQNDINNTELQRVLTDVFADGTYDDYSYLFGKSFKQSNKKAKYLRSIFKFGGPLEINGKKYQNRYDDEEKQEDEFVDFTEKVIDIIDDINSKSGSDDVNLLVFSGPSANILFQKTIGQDFLWALASIVFVWGYLTFHLQSFFLSSFSMLNILMSFPITLTIVRLMFQVSYFSSLHILVIFIVLGIAADDVFVFQDAWKQTEQYSILATDLNKRMAVTFKRASKAMLATSSTTSAAFLATGFSKIMPISSFGIFAGILIPINYVLVITFYPAILIVHYKYFLKCDCCPCLKKNKTKNNNQQDNNNNNEIGHVRQDVPDVYEEQQQKTENKDIQQEIQVSVPNEPNQQLQQQPQQGGQGGHTKELSKIEHFFGNPFNQFVVKFKYVFLVLITAWTGVAIWRATKMGPQTEPDKWLPDHYELQRALDYLTNGFIQSGESANVIEVTLFLGLDSINTDGTSQWDAGDAGKAVFDSSFNMSSEQNQQYIVDFCDTLESNSLVLDGAISCFMQGFRTYVTDDGANPGDFPVAQADFVEKLEEFALSPEGQDYYLQSLIGLYKGKLNYAAILATSIGQPEAGYQDQEPIEERWAKLVSDYNKNAPSGIRDMQQASETWAWMVSQRELVRQAFSGMIISLAFALLVLILSTHNIIVSLYSILSISGIVVSVVTVMELSGWQMGVAESITIVILIGFSVDYVVHLANHYVESSYSDRHTRMQEALQEIGISIVSGAITTLGSGIFLFFAVISIFSKFAILIVSTISFSLIYSLLFFASLMHAFGPQGDFGNILVLCKKKNSQVNSEQQVSEKQKELVAEQAPNKQVEADPVAENNV